MATICNKGFSKRTSVGLWLMTEIAVIGSDIQEVLGSAIALKILFGIEIWAGVLITMADTFLIMFLQQVGAVYVLGVDGSHHKRGDPAVQDFVVLGLHAIGLVWPGKADVCHITKKGVINKTQDRYADI